MAVVALSHGLHAVVQAPTTAGSHGPMEDGKPTGQRLTGWTAPDTRRRRGRLRVPGGAAFRGGCCFDMARCFEPQVEPRCRWIGRYPYCAALCASACWPQGPLTTPSQTPKGSQGSRGGFCEGVPACIDYRTDCAPSEKAASTSIDADQVRACGLCWCGLTTPDERVSGAETGLRDAQKTVQRAMSQSGV